VICPILFQWKYMGISALKLSRLRGKENRQWWVMTWFAASSSRNLGKKMTLPNNSEGPGRGEKIYVKRHLGRGGKI